MIGVVAVLVTIIFLMRLWYRRDGNLPPGPRGIPIVGVLPFLGKHPAKILQKWSAKYGQFYTARLGQHDYLILNDYDSIQEIYVKQSDKSCGRPPLHIFDILTKTLGIIFSNQRVWKGSRPFAAHTLRRLGMGREIIETRLQEEASYLTEAIQAKGETHFDIRDLLFLCVANIIISMTLGSRLDYSDEQYHRLVHHLLRGWQNEGPLILTSAFTGYLHCIPPFRYACKRMQEDYDYLYDLFRMKIKEHEKSAGNEVIDFIDAFLEETKKKDHDKTFTEEHLVVFIKDLLEAGSQTTSTTLVWCILIMLKYPENQIKLREEVDAVIGFKGAVRMKHREEMPFTLAFIHEVMRICTMVPMTHVRTVEEAEIHGFKIPKNTPVSSNLWAVHHNPKYFEEPFEFRPQRFISKGSFVKPKYWMPFSVGGRNCVGEQLANMEIFTFLVTIIQNFEIVADKSQLPNLDDGENGIIYIPKPFKAGFLQREY